MKCASGLSFNHPGVIQREDAGVAIAIARVDFKNSSELKYSLDTKLNQIFFRYRLNLDKQIKDFGP